MTVRGLPSPVLRRRVRRALWRHRHLVRAALVGVAVLCTPQTIASRQTAATHTAPPRSTTTSPTPAAAAGTGPLDGVSQAGLVTTLVRLADPGAHLLVRPGDVVDILATAPLAPDPVLGVVPSGDSSASVVASGARVVDVPATEQPDAAPQDGTVLVVAVTAATARALAGVATSRLSVVVRFSATAH